MHTLPELEYKYDAFGKYISKDIMELHHSKHHQAYIDKLNATLEEVSDLKEHSLEDLLRNLHSLPEKVQKSIQNSVGGHYNHTLFWQFLSPDSSEEPKGELKNAIIDKYGSFQGFIDKFTAESLGIFGSGWAWLMPDLSIVTTPNQDTPISSGLPEPILGLDVWEHAYYLDYTYNRADYVAAWWHVANWSGAADRFAKHH